MKSIVITFIVAVVALVKGELFAIVGGSQCAEALNYGQSTINVQSGSQGHLYYFDTTPDAGHTQWLQIVTSDGYTELFRILYTFQSFKLLVDRFISYSVHTVDWTVTDTAGLAGAAGLTYTFNGGTWQYSSASQVTSTTFTAGGVFPFFSDDSGAWGAASTAINGAVGTVPAEFWGIGNFNAADSTCQTIYANGVSQGTFPASRSYMYTGTTGSVATAPPSSQPSTQPTTQPSRRPSTQPSRRPSTQPSSRPTGQPSRRPTGQPSRQPSTHPTTQPFTQPSSRPTGQPSRRPTGQPTTQPSGKPSRQPSGQPSRQPTSAPSRFARKRGYHMRYPPTSG